jgi:nucleoside-diphosphate-sugar epimerase
MVRVSGEVYRGRAAFTHYGVSKLNFDFTLDITRAQDELGYQPVVTLDAPCCGR